MHISRPPYLVTTATAAALVIAAVALPTAVLRQGGLRHAVAADQRSTGTPSPAEQAHADLHAQYAEARLRLAQANLARAEALAAAVPRQVNDLELASLRRRVSILARNVETTRDHPHDNGYRLAQVAAQAAVDHTSEELSAARAANQRQPGTVSPLAERQLEAAVNLARVRHAIWQDPAFLDSPLQIVQMQVDQLADEVFELVQRVDNRFSIDRR